MHISTYHASKKDDMESGTERSMSDNFDQVITVDIGLQATMDEVEQTPAYELYEDDKEGRTIEDTDEELELAPQLGDN